MPKVRHYATPKQLSALITYCEHTGHFYWKECEDAKHLKGYSSPDYHHRKVGTRADRIKASGPYHKSPVIILFGAIISAHQVAFMIKTGRKAALVSSIDGNSLNTRWSNLQEGRAEKFTAHVPKFTVRISENLQKISIENP